MEALTNCETMSLDELKADIEQVAKESIVDLRKAMEI